MTDKIKAQKSKNKTVSTISVLIYAHNDERNIERCLIGARLITSHIILIDIGSTDSTALIASRFGAEVASLKSTEYVELVRMAGINHAKAEWIFILDSDEVVTQELAEEVKRVIATSPTPTHFRIPRKNIFGKSKWLKHGGWWPDAQIRLIRRSALIDWPSVIHSTPQIKGDCSSLKEPLTHFSHGDFSQMVKKTIKFEGTESDLLHNAGRKVNTFIFFRKFFGELFRRLIKERGFMDGNEGVAESVYQAYSKTVTYLMLYEKQR